MFRQREEGGEVEKDFLKKQLQKLVQAIQRVLKLSSDQQHQQAEDELQQIAATSLKLDATRLGSLDPNPSVSPPRKDEGREAATERARQ